MAGLTPEIRGLLNPESLDRPWIERVRETYEQEGGLKLAFDAARRNPDSYSPVTSTYISDNGNYADLARAEIILALQDVDRMVAALSNEIPPRDHYHDVPSQDWRAAAFDLAQLARYRLTGPGNVLFVNCAPRLDQRGTETDNKGEDVYVGMLPNGAVVAGVSPHSFTFFRDLVESGEMEIYKVNVQTNGTQFRSRDFFPAFAELLTYQMTQEGRRGLWNAGMAVDTRRQILGQSNFIDTNDKLGLEDIPSIEEPVVARVDAHGNLKLSLSRSDVQPEWEGQPLQVTIKGRQFDAVIRDHMFDADSGSRGIAPGSSGAWEDSAKDDPRFLEIALMGASLREALEISDQDLKEGVRVFIEPKEPAPSAAPEREPVPVT